MCMKCKEFLGSFSVQNLSLSSAKEKKTRKKESHMEFPCECACACVCVKLLSKLPKNLQFKWHISKSLILMRSSVCVYVVSSASFEKRSIYQTEWKTNNKLQAEEEEARWKYCIIKLTRAFFPKTFSIFCEHFLVISLQHLWKEHEELTQNNIYMFSKKKNFHLKYVWM